MHVLAFSILSMAAMGAVHATSCIEDMMSCVSITQSVGSDMESICELTPKYIECMKSAMTVCKSDPNVPADQIKTFETALESSIKSISICSSLNGKDGTGCLSILDCMDMLTEISVAANNVDMVALCSVGQRFRACVKEPLADCMSNPSIPAEQRKSMMDSIQLGNKSFSVCNNIDTSSESTTDGDVPPANAKCLQILSCMFDPEKFKTAIDAKDTKKACGFLNPSLICMKSALADCKKTDAIKGEELKEVIATMETANDLASTHCYTTTTGEKKEEEQTGDKEKECDDPPCDACAAKPFVVFLVLSSVAALIMQQF